MRTPVVADRFYPGDPEELSRYLDRLVPEISPEAREDAVALVSPHAGYIYSGSVAGETFARVRVPDTVIILGPNHHGGGARLALGMESWRMPMGVVEVDTPLAGEILQRSIVITRDEVAHANEHSLEVQAPFIQHRNPEARIVPIVVGHVSFEECELAARDLVEAIRGFPAPVLMVASTDMTHYESRLEAGRKDRMALEHVKELDGRGLYDTVTGNRISMCGVLPTVITLLAARDLGASRARLVRYTDSGESSGDTRQVVGYAGLVIS